MWDLKGEILLMLVTDVREATATEQNDLKRQNVLMLVTPKRVYPLHVRECYTFCILYYIISCYMYTSAVTKSISLPMQEAKRTFLPNPPLSLMVLAGG